MPESSDTPCEIQNPTKSWSDAIIESALEMSPYAERTETEHGFMMHLSVSAKLSDAGEFIGFGVSHITDNLKGVDRPEDGYTYIGIPVSDLERPERGSERHYAEADAIKDAITHEIGIAVLEKVDKLRVGEA